jgi:hypothetical protein
MVVGALVGLHWVLRNTTLEEAAGRIPWWLRSVTLALMLAGLFVAKEDARAFIYFQF